MEGLGSADRDLSHPSRCVVFFNTHLTRTSGDILASRPASRILPMNPRITIGRREWRIYEAKRVRWQLPSLVYLRLIIAEWYVYLPEVKLVGGPRLYMLGSH